MADPLQIPTTAGNPDYTQRTRLDGREYLLHFKWNQLCEHWTLDIYDDVETILVSGIKLIANWPLLRFYQWDSRMPPGNLVVVDLTPDGSPPGFEDLEIGRRCELVYYPATEL